MNLKQNVRSTGKYSQPSSKERSKIKDNKLSGIIKGLHYPKISMEKLTRKKYSRDESTQKCIAPDSAVSVASETITVSAQPNNQTDESNTVDAESSRSSPFSAVPLPRSRSKYKKSTSDGTFVTFLFAY